MSRTAVIILKWLAILVSVGLLVLGVLEARNAARDTVYAMHRVGWSAYIRRPPSSLSSWLGGCMLYKECQRAFLKGYRRFYPIWIPIAWIASLYAIGVLRIIADGMRKRSELPPGAARWAEKRELRHLIHGEKGSPQRGYLGLLASSRNPTPLRLPERLRCSHCMVVGGSGARKTTGYHKMNVLVDAMEGVSVVLFDLKYPDPKSGFLDCVPYFMAAGFDVQLFLPFEQKTLVFPLLQDVRSLEDAYDVVDMIMPPPLRDHPANFYRDQERQLLVAFVLGVVQDHLRKPEDPYAGPPNLRRIFQLCLSGRAEIERYIHTHPDRRVREAAAGLFELDERLLSGIAAGVAGRLQLFNDERLERATTPVHDPRLVVQLQRIGEVPTLLYIGIPQEKVQGGRGQLVLQLIKRAIERALMQTADRHGGQLPRHVSIYMDEFAAMGPLPNVSEMMATMRSRRIAYHLSLQNKAQGEALYGVTGFRSFFNNNVQTVIIFPRYLKFDDAQYFSEVLGYMTVEQQSMGVTKRFFEILGGSRTDWVRDVLRPLVPPEEYPDWPEAMGILFTTGVRPTKVLFPRLDEDRVMGVANPFVGFRKYVFPATALASSEEGRRKLIDALMEYHFRWADKNFPGIREVLGEVRPLWEHPILSPGRVEAPQVEVRAASPEPSTVAVWPEDAQSPLRPPSIQGDNDAGREARRGDRQHGEAPEDLVESLRGWARQVAQLGLPREAVRAHFHNRRLTRLGIYRAALPTELSAPTRLAEWMAQRWVKVTPSEIALLPRSFHLIRREDLGTLRKLSRRQDRWQIQEEVNVSSGSSRAETISSQDASDQTAGAREALRVIREWVLANGVFLEGHTDRSADAELKGFYEAGQTVALLPEVVAGILREAGIPDRQQKTFREYWRDAGLIHARAPRTTTSRWFGGRSYRVIAFPWAALFDVDYSASG